MRSSNYVKRIAFGIVIITLLCASACHSSIVDSSFIEKADKMNANDNVPIKYPTVTESSILKTTKVTITVDKGFSVNYSASLGKASIDTVYIVQKDDSVEYNFTMQNDYGKNLTISGVMLKLYNEKNELIAKYNIYGRILSPTVIDSYRGTETISSEVEDIKIDRVAVEFTAISSS